MQDYLATSSPKTKQKFAKNHKKPAPPFLRSLKKFYCRKNKDIKNEFVGWKWSVVGFSSTVHPVSLIFVAATRGNRGRSGNRLIAYGINRFLLAFGLFLISRLWVGVCQPACLSQ